MCKDDTDSLRTRRDGEQRGKVATGFCSSVPRAGGTPDRKRLGDWQGIRDSAKVGRRLGSATRQVEMEDKGAAG